MPSEYKSLAGVPGVTQNDAPSGNWDELAFNNGAATVSGHPIGNGNPVLTDVNVRHAISYSLDLPKLAERPLQQLAIDLRLAHLRDGHGLLLALRGVARQRASPRRGFDRP